MTILVFMCPTETSMMTEKEKHVPEMKFLRCGSGYCLRDQKCNEGINTEMVIYTISDKIEYRKYKWM